MRQVFGAALLVPALLASAQEALTVGDVVSGTFETSDAHEFTLELGEDTFVMGFADQVTVDVVVQVFDPAGERIVAQDGPGRGPERFQFDTEEPGAYRIEVAPFEDELGDYTLTITLTEPVATHGPKRVDQLMAAYDNDQTPGGVIGVVQGGELTFAKAYGMSNLTYAVRFEVDTKTNIGSTSKQFTAFAICLLAQQGKLSLDDDIRTHIPELPDLGQTVTIRNLLTHTSGYREFLNLLAMSGRQLGLGDTISRDEMIEIIQRQTTLQNDPGAEWNYNNTGYALMTIVVENVSGQPFDEWMDEHVFTPLGMDDTVVRTNRLRWIENSSMGYVPDEGGYVEGPDLGGAMGAGAIYTTVEDLAAWIGNLSTGELGGKEVIEEMTTKFTLNNGDETPYGLGLFIADFRGLQSISHGGADTAHRAMLQFYPEIDAGVIALSNNGSFPAGGIANEVAEAFFRDKMTFDDPEASAEPTEPADSAFDLASYDASTFDALAGRYELEEMAGFVLTFTREEDKVFIQATGQPKLEITPTSETTFELAMVGAAIEFHLDDDGTCSSLTLNQNGVHPAKRLEEEAWKPSEAQLEAYAGQYLSDELGTFYTIIIEESGLVVKHRRFSSTLKEMSEHRFTGTFPIATLDFDVDEDGNVTGFTIGNGRTRDIQFDKQD